MSEYDADGSGTTRCDRCAEEHPVLRFGVEEPVCWLCYDCVDAVCRIWLVEHAELIARHRALLGDAEQAEREPA